MSPGLSLQSAGPMLFCHSATANVLMFTALLVLARRCLLIKQQINTASEQEAQEDALREKLRSCCM